MTIVVTGGTKGIGLAIAKRLASTDQTLVLAYHADDRAAAGAKASIEPTGARVETVCADIGTIAGASALMARVAKIGEPLTCLVHSAAMIYPTTLLDADL
jgi:NAD(P)-dependent dehydrogenase (short-subunit alcohol dehydrogenase family)